MTGRVLPGVDVSRETLDKLEHYSDLLARWNPKINLVAPSTLSDAWERHFADSAQVLALAPKDAGSWVDLGSGGGFPGLVCAILGAELMPDCKFALIESDQRKAAFLMTVVRDVKLPITVHAERIERIAPAGAEVVSARALAPLSQLLVFVTRHLSPSGVALLQKGKGHAEELATAQQEWQFKETSTPSQTDEQARVLILKDITRG
ncbi:MAG: 16S rRNA (guanine(527)-N(7))-methyltransferase RsmG [Roseinatronobacter sp.]